MPQTDPGPVFAALADPTRRQVIELLSRHPGMTASSLAGELPVSRQAIAKHLAQLRDAGLASAEVSGRETRYRLTPEPMAGAMAWMAEAGAQWDARLERLRRQL
ncbi:MAG TPA: metalloregulator ArsR/SmtB family transcription factor [Baekduia sp.]|uniref:ArsR/SmtB family transcription factor n=1 Tax=Baekduia sp. TaxID=2600305 RepID=UPI002D767A2F|nr:metalloregulator ArsR/SmtB family transcription factor [Baekduia sp.]HET6507651.1 metalloregulator ArsR/SmtB family transcription factor [Baekduia sp.]